PAYSYRYVWRPPFYISDIAFHPRSSSPILAGAGDAVIVWQLGEQTTEELCRIDRSGPVHFSADGRYLFLNGSDGLEIWNWRANVPLKHPPLPAYLDVNKDGSVLATEDESRQVRLWNIGALLLPKPILLGQTKKTALLPNFPNPFNPETWFPYRLSELTNVRIRIHDVSGRQVRVLNLGAKPAGDYLSRSQAAYWDGRNDARETVSSGLYFYTLEAGESTVTRRMLIQR
ncbi:MAG: T9SS type A sorting domain-containing protein, partial [Candidatus Poribacteria bacterium]|nr:T9SS type A sorting domain-containing protein [Candidatus Poribacteria bacterium]